MLQEGPSKQFHWKNKLNELESLPSEPATNKMASWEKLHRRLSQKKGSNRMIWYWTAAACVLVVLGLSRFFTSEKTNSTVTDNNLQHNQRLLTRKEIVNNKEPAKVDTQQKASDLKNIKNHPVIFDTKKNHFFKNEVVIEKPNVSERDSTHEAIPEIAISVIEPPDTIHAVATSIPSSMKKLRVVHINELGKSMDHEAQLVKTRSFGLVVSKNPNDSFPVFSMSKNASDNLVKIKLSPSN